MIKFQQSYNTSFARRPNKVKVKHALPNNYIIMKVIGPMVVSYSRQFPSYVYIYVHKVLKNVFTFIGTVLSQSIYSVLYFSKNRIHVDSRCSIK
jgi:hypothetical protein